jgi:hypothetical protein
MYTSPGTVVVNVHDAKVVAAATTCTPPAGGDVHIRWSGVRTGPTAGDGPADVRSIDVHAIGNTIATIPNRTTRGVLIGASWQFRTGPEPGKHPVVQRDSSLDSAHAAFVTRGFDLPSRLW